MAPSILLLGTGGQVGHALQETLPAVGPTQGFDRAALDLTDTEAIRHTVRHHRPDIIVNAAAYTAVDRAETEQELAFAVNATAPGVLAEAAAACGALLVHYSTDYVFDGTRRTPYPEDAPTHPLNVYGASKLAGEEAIQAAGCAHLIFRTTWVYGPRGHNFLKTMLRLAGELDTIRVVEDQVGAPTSSLFLAKATGAILQQWWARPADERLRGVFNLTTAGQTNWYGFAHAIFADRPDAPQLVPIPSSAYPTPAHRPAYSTLAHDKLRATFELEVPDWQAALADVQAAL